MGLLNSEIMMLSQVKIYQLKPSRHFLDTTRLYYTCMQYLVAPGTDGDAGIASQKPEELQSDDGPSLYRSHEYLAHTYRMLQSEKKGAISSSFEEIGAWHIDGEQEQ